MIRSKEATGKTVEEARAAACAALGVSEDDLNVSYEVLEMPQSTGFLGLKKIPAKVRVIVEEEDPAPAAPEKPAVKVVRAEKAQPAEPAEKAEKAQPAPAPQPAEKPAPQPAPAQKPAAAPAAQAPAAAVTAAPAAVDETPVPIDIETNPKVKAAVEYLKEIVALMGVEDVTFSAIQKGEATIIRLDGDKMGALIGRRGETMESLSYLASLVINRMDGPYIKLGIDVGGYRGKREEDLHALARRIAERVQRTGCCYEMEPMNPYERHIIHTAIANIEGVRSESKGEGKDRRVVIYSTDPDASNLPDRESIGRRSHGPRRDDRRGRGPRRDGRGGNRGGRGPRREGGRGYGKGPRNSSVPGREFASAPRDPEAKPQAPARSTRINDSDDFEMFGKIEL